MSGSMTARRSDPLDPSSQPFENGDRLAVRYRDARATGASWREEVRLQVNAPDSEPDTGVVNFEIVNPFVGFEDIEGFFSYRKDKRHPNPWYMDEIIRSACRRVGAPTGTIVRGRHPFDSIRGSALGADKKHTPRSSLTEFVQKVMGVEMTHTGRRLLQSVENGRLAVLDVGARDRAYILDLSAQLLEVTTRANARPPTVIIAHGHVGKGKASKHVVVEVSSRIALAKFGRIPFEENYGRVNSESDLRERATRLLAKKLRHVRTGTATVQGLPGAQPWDAVLLSREENRPGVPGYQGRISPDEFGGPHGIVFISNRSHTIQAGIWTTELSLQERDPWLTYRSKLIEHKLRGKKQKHKSPSKNASSKPSSSPAASAHKTAPKSSAAHTANISGLRSGTRS